MVEFHKIDKPLIYCFCIRKLHSKKACLLPQSPIIDNKLSYKSVPEEYSNFIENQEILNDISKINIDLNKLFWHRFKRQLVKLVISVRRGVFELVCETICQINRGWKNLIIFTYDSLYIYRFYITCDYST